MHDRDQRHRPEPDRLDRFLDSVDLDVDIADLKADREQLKLLAAISRLIRRKGDQIMATLGPINDALTALSAQITQLAAQVGELQAGTVTQEQIDQIASDISDAAASVDAIVEPDAGEGEPPAEEPA